MSLDVACTAPPVTGGRILVVDDDAAVTCFLQRLLSQHGYEVEIAHDGESALGFIEARPPDVLILDMILPGLTGLELCRRLKQDEATRLLPVVLVSGNDEHANRVGGLAA